MDFVVNILVGKGAGYYANSLCPIYSWGFQTDYSVKRLKYYIYWLVKGPGSMPIVYALYTVGEFKQIQIFNALIT